MNERLKNAAIKYEKTFDLPPLSVLEFLEVLENEGWIVVPVPEDVALGIED